MTQDDFELFRTHVDSRAESYWNTESGVTVVKFSDGGLVRVDLDGDSRPITPIEAERLTGLQHS